jgi:predicted phosphodiesterase
MAGVTWLHLSDWHQKGPDFDKFNRQVVCDALIQDIRERASIDPALLHVDFAVFSGDLAFSGKPDEYKAAQGHLLDPVLEAVNLKPSADQKANRLFVVPGNHDLDRDIAHDKEWAPAALQKPIASPDEVATWLTEARKFLRVVEPFEAYREFVIGYTGQDSPAYASILRLEAGGKQIALLGLNSAWMCARNRDTKDEINDYGYALVGEPQIHGALAKITDANLRIVVLHHPFEWLAEFDRSRIKARLKQACHFILSGHEHSSQVEVMHGTLGNCVTIPAGASYNRRTAEDSRYTNAYNFVHLSFDDAAHAIEGVVYLRRWSDKRNVWVEDSDSCADGKYTFSLLEKGHV